jgi:hypothetical protein
MNDDHDDARIRDHFLGWQCRIREHATRHHGGRSSPGLNPAYSAIYRRSTPGSAGAST